VKGAGNPFTWTHWRELPSSNLDSCDDGLDLLPEIISNKSKTESLVDVLLKIEERITDTGAKARCPTKTRSGEAKPPLSKGASQQ
jgi:hypothetical protein